MVRPDWRRFALAWTTVLLVVTGFSLSLVSVMTVPGSCQHKVNADIVDVRPDQQYGMCALTLRYRADGADRLVVKTLPCAEDSDAADKVVRGCWRHWDPDVFLVGDSEYLSYSAVVCMLTFAAVSLVIAPVMGVWSCRITA